MTNNNRDYLSYVATISAVLSLFITFKGPNFSEIESLYIFLILIIFVIYFVFDYFRTRVLDYSKNISNLNNKFSELNKELDFNKKFYKLESEINVMKLKFSKKGSIDPRVIMVALMVFFLFLLIRSVYF